MSPTGTPTPSSAPTARRDHRRAEAGHHRRPGLRRLVVVLTRRDTGYPYPPWPASCSGWASRPPLPQHGPGRSRGPVGAVVAAGQRSASWAPMKPLVWLIRTSGAVERGPSAEHLGEDAARRDAGVLLRSRPLTASTPPGTTAHLSAQGWRPGSGGGQPATHASAQQDDRVAEADADNDAAVAAYRLSVQVGNPFSERKLAQTFGRTSRRWARAEDRRSASITNRA